LSYYFNNLVEVVELDEGGEGEDAHNPHVGQVLQAAAGASEPHPESIESFIEDQAFSPLSELPSPLPSVRLTGDK
jgi:hypothetical protein